MRPSLRKKTRVPEDASEKINLLQRILLGEVTCDEFMDEKHCLYAKEILSERLKGLTEVWVGREYVIAVVWDGSFTAGYLIGRDSDTGLLFVNRVTISNDDEDEVRGRLIAESENIKVYSVRDTDVKRVILGYDYDVVESMYTIDKPGAYRAQGDVVLRVRPITQDAVERIVNRIASVVSGLAVVDFVTGVLIEHDIGASVDVPPIDVVTTRGEELDEQPPAVIMLPVNPTLGERGWEVASRIADMLADELNKYFGTELKATYVKKQEELVIAEQVKQRVGKTPPSGVLALRPGNYAITILVRGAPSSLLNRIADAVRGTLLNYLHSNDGAVDATLKAGRHLVILNNVKSATFTLNTAQLVNLHYLNDRNITVQLTDPPGYVVNKDSVITLRHIQHREKTLRFADEFLVTVTHVRTAPRYVDELNAVVLNQLLKENAKEGDSSQESS